MKHSFKSAKKYAVEIAAIVMVWSIVGCGSSSGPSSSTDAEAPPANNGWENPDSGRTANPIIGCNDLQKHVLGLDRKTSVEVIRSILEISQRIGYLGHPTIESCLSPELSIECNSAQCRIRRK